MVDDENIAFLIHETGWSLEYIRAIPLSELYCLIDELSYQKRLRDYQLQAMFASIMAVFSRGEIKPLDIVGQPPLRAGTIRQESNIWLIATKAGLRIPTDRT